ncbi:warthog protein 4-like [Amphiura filiformis]|uniref:warthog protein 4-like n=1 Tax=Amphiura filiformis TaxID=82378 RepID=UPI003B218FE7
MEEEKRNIEAEANMANQTKLEITAAQKVKDEELASLKARVKSLEVNAELKAKEIKNVKESQKLEEETKAAKIGALEAEVKRFRPTEHAELQPGWKKEAALRACKSKKGQDLKFEFKNRGGGCFASDSMVRVQYSQGRVTLKSLEDLAVGDLVQSYDPETNCITYSPIYYIIYQDENYRKSFLRELFYQGMNGKEHSLRLQGKHLLYATINLLASVESERPPSTPIMSEKVNVGDVLWLIDEHTGELFPRRVLKIGEIVANVRHPMTMNHTIIVDGVLASVHMHNEWLLRQATVPLRLLYHLSPRLSDFWLSKKAIRTWDYVEQYLLE